MENNTNYIQLWKTGTFREKLLTTIFLPAGKQLFNFFSGDVDGTPGGVLAA
jgi:hypothetical protein